MTKRPSIKSPCVADRYAMTGERIAEFRIGKIGGLISLRETLIGGARLEVYRVDGGPLEIVTPADPLRDAAPAMRDALALALERVEMNNYGGEEDAAIAEIKAALALAGGDTVAGTAAGPDYEALARAAGWNLYRLEDGAGAADVEFYAWRGGNVLEPEHETSAVPDEATAWRDACEHDGLSGDTVAAMSAPQDDADAMRLALESAEHWLTEEAANPGQTTPDEILRVIRAALGKG